MTCSMRCLLRVRTMHGVSGLPEGSPEVSSFQLGSMVFTAGHAVLMGCPGHEVMQSHTAAGLNAATGAWPSAEDLSSLH